MSNSAPPPWVKRAPGLSATHKFLFMVLWAWGPFQRKGPVEPDGDRQPARPVRIFPSRETLAEVTGQPLGTVKSQLDKLRSLGWIRRESGSNMTLAWRAPNCFDYGHRLDSQPPLANPTPVESSACQAESSAAMDEISTPRRLNPPPQSYSDLPIVSSTELAAAHTTPSESTTPDDDTNENRTHEANPPEGRQDVVGHALAASAVVGQAPRVTLPAAYPEHVRAKHAQVTQSSHVAPPGNSNGSPAGGHSPGEPSFADRIDAACAAASIAHSNTATSAHSAAWTPSMVAAMAEFDHGEDDVIRVLEAWQAAPRTERPAMGSLWHAWGRSPGFWFVEQVLGTGSAPAKREALSDVRAPGESEGVFAALDRRREAEAAEYAASMAGGAA